MKFVICVGDGMADEPIAELNGLTPLEYASTPNMDRVATRGRVGMVQTVPDGLPPGSDVANMSLLGYDAKLYYQGRAPIEAASMGIRLMPDDTAFRCNLVTLSGAIMDDYSAGHIETADAHELVKDLQSALGDKRTRLYPGVSYRHCLVISGMTEGPLSCTPPHDISGRPWKDHLPRGTGSEELLSLMDRARVALANSATNKRRIAAGKKPATDIWLWGQGHAIRLPTMKERFGLSGSVISAVDLVQGLGVLAGLTVRKVDGATGYLGTNYAGKVSAALRALSEEDFVFIHVEAPDETSHEGSLKKKIQAIEEFDRHIVGELLKAAENHKDLRLLVLPDHATPLSLKTHCASPVPFAVCGPGITPDNASTYNEKAAAGISPMTAEKLFETFITGVM
jgi:2,3-bisphosphoglycerate-independent phosphoglycerate mutase